MAFSGGVFSRIYNWVSDANANIPITASRMDSEMDGMATGLSTCLLKDGTQTVTANIPMAGFKFTGVGSATARNQYISAGQIQDGGVSYCGTSGGTANAQTLTPSPVITAYAAGQEFSFLPVATNTSGTVTIANSALTARNVKKGIGGAKVILAIGDIIINVPAKIIDDGTDYILLNPQTYTHGADVASATTTNLDTATGDLVDVTGTTTITAITLSEGRQCTVRFTGALTLTNGASLVLPGAANITTVAGDYAVFRGYAAGVVRCVNYLPTTYSPISSGTITAASIAITFGTPGNLSVAYTTRDVTWTKIGNRVCVRGNIVTSSFTHTTASGNLVITGALPFMPSKLAPGSVLLDGFSSITGSIICAANTDNSLIFYFNGTGVPTQITTTQTASGSNKTLIFAVEYEV